MKDTPIGLSELINQVKRELLEEPVYDNTPLLSVEEIELEILVTATKKVEGGINIQVIELGAGVERSNVHTVRVKLLPLLTHEERLASLKDDSRWGKIVEIQKESLIKGINSNLPNPNEYG